MERKAFQIGHRTIKTAIGSGGALFLAQFLELQNFSTAAVITLLSIQSTKKKSLVIALQRFLACMIAMGIGALLFTQLGYDPLAVIIYFLFVLPLLARLGLHEGIVVSSVIVLQLYVVGNVSVAMILNQIYIIVIGISFALLMNLYMPSIEKDLHEAKRKIEESYKYIFITLSVHMKREEQEFSESLLQETEELIKVAKELAFKELENTFLEKSNYYYAYFEMRDRQFMMIRNRIVPILASLHCSYEQTNMVATFLEEVALSIYEENTAEQLITGLEDLRKQFEEMALPQSRQEFETRASLLNLVKELESFLHIKRAFREEWSIN